MKKITLLATALLLSVSLTSCLTPEAIAIAAGTYVAKKASKTVNKKVKKSMKKAVSQKVKNSISESILPLSIGINAFSGKTFTFTDKGIDTTWQVVDGKYINATFKQGDKTWNGVYEYSHNQVNHTLYITWSKYPVMNNMNFVNAMSLEDIRSYLKNSLENEENYKNQFMSSLQNPAFRTFCYNYTGLDSTFSDDELYEYYLQQKKSDLDLNRGAGWGRFKNTEYYEQNTFYTHEFNKLVEYKYQVNDKQISLVRHIDKDETFQFLYKYQKLPNLCNVNENDPYQFNFLDDIFILTDKANNTHCEYAITEFNSCRIVGEKLFIGEEYNSFKNKITLSYKEEGKSDKKIMKLKYNKQWYDITWPKTPIVLTQM